MNKELEQFKKENCSKCTKNIDCKIIRQVDGKLTCTEEEQNMVQCLIDNKVCPATNKRCKNCSLEDCKRTIEMIETQEEREDKWKRKLINVQLPEQCKNCSFLEVINLDEQIVRCPYRVKERCLIK